MSRYTPPKPRPRTRVRITYSPDTPAGKFPGEPQALNPPKPFLRKGVDPKKLPYKRGDVIGRVLSFDGAGRYTVEVDEGEVEDLLAEFGAMARVLA